MKQKDTLTMPDVSIAERSRARPGLMERVTDRMRKIIRGLILYLKGGEKEVDATPDPAIPIINEIQDTEVRKLVKELHFLTPRTLKTMRDTCTKCFIVPEDCPYVDYSIPDINKAVRRINKYPELADSPERVLDELARVNAELAHHLRVNFGLEEEQTEVKA